MESRKLRSREIPLIQSRSSNKTSAKSTDVDNWEGLNLSRDTSKPINTPDTEGDTDPRKPIRRDTIPPRLLSEDDELSTSEPKPAEAEKKYQKSGKRQLDREEGEGESQPNKRVRPSCHDSQTDAMQTFKEALKNEEYTVGWISALEIEYTAAQMALDERHGTPSSVSKHDNNGYTLGKIRDHNVVLAVLPEGEYGLVTAAAVARDMRHSFPNVRIGLMVGIGGGAPSYEHDVRLGDVVVGIPSKGNGAVFQYDYGKARQGQEYLPMSTLDQPPIALRTAVTNLKSNCNLFPQRLARLFDEILEPFPHLHETYGRPDSSTDQLFKSHYVHEEGQIDCSRCSENPDVLVNRLQRQTPQIHYGPIASANTLMKDALIRDELVHTKKILCFEMEAAGLVQHFPCLVVRGICDYADSHKNKQWQGYAALAAAAYTKYLLQFVHRNQVEAERAIGDILSGVESMVKKLHDTKATELTQSKHEALLDWFHKVHPARQQRYFIKQAVEGTGNWFFQTEEFKSWLDSPSQTMFCPGPAGTGKTTMMAIMIQHLKEKFQSDPRVVVAHIYFGYLPAPVDEKELYAILFKQLALTCSDLPHRVIEMYEQNKSEDITIVQAQEALATVLQVYSRTLIVVDALDECQIPPGLIGKFLKFIFARQKLHNISLIATSRNHSSIAAMFQDCMILNIRASDNDVTRYLNHRTGELEPNDPIRSGEQMHQEVGRVIRESANGMFLLARLHFDYLAQSPTLGYVRDKMRGLTANIDEAYEQIMEKLKTRPGSSFAMSLISCMVFAKRILTVQEIQRALAVRPRALSLDGDDIIKEETIGSLCPGLVIIESNSQTVQWAHASVKGYFQRRKDYWFRGGEIHLARVCLTYLSFDTFALGPCQNSKDLNIRLQENPFYQYAALNWGLHANATETDCDLHADILTYLTCSKKSRANRQAMVGNTECTFPSEDNQEIQEHGSGLHLAAYFGLHQAVVQLMSKGFPPDAKEAGGVTPLSLAMQQNQLKVAESLLALPGLNINHYCSGGSPLLWALKRRHNSLAERLIMNPRVDLCKGDDRGRTPVELAGKMNDGKLMRLLLSKDVDPNFADRHGWKAIHWAALYGHEDTLSALIDEPRVNVNSQTDEGYTALACAAGAGHKGALEILLQHSVIIDTVDKWGRTPLSRAAGAGHFATVALLLEDSNVVYDLRDKEGKNALYWAATNGYTNIVNLLLQSGSEPDFPDENNRSPLAWAVENGHAEIVRLLLETNKVNIERKDKWHMTPVDIAIGKRYNRITRDL